MLRFKVGYQCAEIVAHIDECGECKGLAGVMSLAFKAPNIANHISQGKCGNDGALCNGSRRSVKGCYLQGRSPYVTRMSGSGGSSDPTPEPICPLDMETLRG